MPSKLITKIMQLRKEKFKDNTVTKRQKLIVSASLLGAMLLLSQSVPGPFKYLAISLFVMITIIFAIWCLKEDLDGVGFLTLITLPTCYSAAVGLSFFLLPDRWFIQLPVAILYSTGMYLILLTENVFNVAAIRTIELIRVAHAAGHLFTVVISFLLFNIIYSFHLDPFFHTVAIALVTAILILQNVWSIELKETIEPRVILYTILLTFAVAQIALILSLWPVGTTIGAIFLSLVINILLGVTREYFMRRLNGQVLLEFVAVSIIIILFFLFFVLIILNSWRG